MSDEKKSRYTEAQAKAAKKYLKESVEDIRIRGCKGNKAKVQKHAANMGESMNSFVVRAIDETMERDTQKQASSKEIPSDALNSPSHSSITGFSPETERQIDLKRLLSDFLYQIDISAAYGNEVLASLLDKARKQQATETK